VTVGGHQILPTGGHERVPADGPSTPVVIGERTYASAYRHLCHEPDSADYRFAAVVIRSSRRLTG
jgi:hypothetical protein